jgi:hypothetical protein
MSSSQIFDARRFSSLALLLLLSTFFAPFKAQAQGGCTTSSLNGTYYYILDGNVASGNQVLPSAELGRLNADGNGSVSGQSNFSIGGTLQSASLSGTYAVDADCTGTLTLTVKSASGTSTETLTFQVISSGQSAVVAFSSSGGVITGQAYRAASVGASQCGNGLLTGGYGYLLAGTEFISGSSYFYSDAGQVVSDGRGGITVRSVANLGSGALPSTGIGNYSIAGDCSGTAQVVNQNGTINYNVAVVEGNNVLFLATNNGYTVSGTAQPQSVQVVLPQFAFGGGWYSALYFTNTNSSSVSFTVTFTSDSGEPLTIPAIGGASTVVTMGPHGTAVIEAPNLGSLRQGYVSLAPPVGVVGYGIFRQSISGRPDQEAVVTFSDSASTSRTLSWDETVSTTTVAIVNPSPTAVNVSIMIWNTNGNVIGTSSVALAPHNKTAVALNTLPGLSGMVGNRGSAQFTVSTGNVAVLGLRFLGSAFTSIPTFGN